MTLPPSDIHQQVSLRHFALNPLIAGEAARDFPGADPAFLETLAAELPGPATQLQPGVRDAVANRYPDGSPEAREIAHLELEAMDELENGDATGIRRTWRGLHFAWSAVRLPGRVVRVLASGPCVGEAAEAPEWIGCPAWGGAGLEAAFALQDSAAAAAGRALAHHLRTRELSQQVVQSERTRSLGTLSNGISHHFNGLLSVILGYASFILNREDLHDDTKKALQHITEAAQRGRRLTEELLSFSGEESDDEMICRVHDSMENVISLLESQGAGRCKIERRLEATDQRVYGLPSDVHQIIFSLLSMVLDRCGRKEEILVRTHNVDLGANEEARRYLRIDVDCTAPTEAPLDKVGQAQRELQITNLYGMVRRLEGTVVVGSPESPAHVEVLLPVTQAPDTATAPEARKRPKRVASTIWVIDDDRLFREMCAQVLSEEGHKVREFSDGIKVQAHFAAGEERPDLFLIDFSMPEINGLELRTWIREHGCSSPVVLVSGLAPNQPDIKKALKMRKTYFLQKPFSFQELSDMASIAMGETLIGE